MDNTEFTKLAESAIALIADTIETEDKDCVIEVDFQGDILNLVTGQGVYVINKHSAAKEIWLSSPISGPHHFYYNADKWQSRNNIDLFTILQQELEITFTYVKLSKLF